MAKRQRKNQAKRTKTKAGYWVQSHSEAKIDNWLFKQKVNYVYEPVFWLDEKRIVPDWVILPTPELGIEQSIIIEYWGLDYSPSQMKQVSGWVKDLRPKISETKENERNCLFRNGRLLLYRTFARRLCRFRLLVAYTSESSVRLSGISNGRRIK